LNVVAFPEEIDGLTAYFRLYSGSARAAQRRRPVGASWESGLCC
jgi:hypothetical protein